MTTALPENDRSASGASSPDEEQMAELLSHTIDVPVLAEAVAAQMPADAADTLEHLEEGDALDVLEAMSVRAAADAIVEMEPPLQASVVEDLINEGKIGLTVKMLGHMAPDDAVDLLQIIDDEAREALLAAMPAAGARVLRELFSYGEETSGGMMTNDFIALRQEFTVTQAADHIRALKRLPEAMHHLPVVDVAGRLTGVVALRRLLISAPDIVISDIMNADVKAIPDDLDREDVAREFERYDYFMMPVIDADQRLVGIVTVDDVIDIIREEQTEDVQMTVGAGRQEAVYSGVVEKLRGRLPWLATSLVLTCVAASVVLFFGDLIERWPVMAFFMPVIAALVGNAGHQALAVTLRGIVLGEMRRDRVKTLVIRELSVGMLNGVCLGALVIGLVFAGRATGVVNIQWQLGVVAGVALAFATSAGTLAGASIPLVMKRVGADPAHSSAIFLIMLTDLFAFATFLGLARLLANWIA